MQRHPLSNAECVAFAESDTFSVSDSDEIEQSGDSSDAKSMAKKKIAKAARKGLEALDRAK